MTDEINRWTVGNVKITRVVEMEGGFIADHVDRDVLVLGTHFPTPAVGHIVREGRHALRGSRRTIRWLVVRGQSFWFPIRENFGASWLPSALGSKRSIIRASITPKTGSIG